MIISFTKMNGAGNDFVVLDNRDLAYSLTKEQIAHLCDRHRGVGADGLLAAEPSEGEADRDRTHAKDQFANPIKAESIRVQDQSDDACRKGTSATGSQTDAHGSWQERECAMPLFGRRLGQRGHQSRIS